MNIDEERDKDFQKVLAGLGQELHGFFWLVGWFLLELSISCLVKTLFSVSGSFNSECLKMSGSNPLKFSISKQELLSGKDLTSRENPMDFSK